jgi:gliding motility-associated-like protein
VYYTTVKTTRGCDSVLFYNVNVLKSPSHLLGSADTCLDNAAVIQLRATEGYDTYWWNGIATNKQTLEVHAPGTYTVRVENSCGFKTDTIVVFDNCDFPIWFPNAFTPNGDFLNDILKVPDMNRNKLKRLSIYNRWGELVFTTTRPGDGWNGTLKGIPQPTAVYVYYLEMEGLAGKKLNQRGTVVLIR